MRDKRFLIISITLALALVAAAFVLRANVWAEVGAPSSVPGQISYQGYLTDDAGQPISGTVTLGFGLYATASGGDPLWEETQGGVPVANGYFTVNLGSANPLNAALFDGPTRYLEVRVDAGDGQVILPRQQLAAVPYALQAEAAVHADLAISAAQASWSGLTGVPEGFADGVDDGAGYGAGNQLELVSDNLNVVEGAGSDLDADLLDGQEGEYYVDWNNLTNAPNQPPVAILQVDESVLYLGEGGQVGANMNLALSYDPEGGPLSYTFDPAGRGQGLPVDFQSSPRAGASFALPGDYLVAGWVQDGAGAVNRAQALVSVYRFGSTLVDSAGNVGLNASLAVVNGRPAIAYPDYSAGNLRYSRALDAAGASWSTPVTVDSGGLVGLSASLTVVDNRPAIAYWNASNDGLKYARASDAAGTSWDTPLTVDSDGHVGEYASLAVVDGRPAIAYFDAFNDDLKYVRASDAAGTSWGTPVTVDGAGAVGTYASLAVVDGRPAIAYYDDFPNQDLKYVIASDAAGTSWETPLTVDSAGAVGYGSSLAVVDGRPAIACWDASNGDLKYVRASDAAGTSWDTPLTVDSAGAVGWRAPLAVVDGRPAIAYWNASNGDLKYVRAQNATGSRWGTPLTLDSAGDVGRSASLAVVDGRPAITYFDNTNGDLRFTIPRQD